MATVEPVSGVRGVVEVLPRLRQPRQGPTPYNGVGRIDRPNSRAPGILRYATVAPRKFGHFVLGAPDYEATRAFFLEGLGFRLSDQVPGRSSLLRCSADHHNAGCSPPPSMTNLDPGGLRRETGTIPLGPTPAAFVPPSGRPGRVDDRLSQRPRPMTTTPFHEPLRRRSTRGRSSSTPHALSPPPGRRTWCGVTSPCAIPTGAGSGSKAPGRGLEEVTAQRVQLVSPDARVLAGEGHPHLECHIHLQVLRAAPERVRSVHTHAEHAIAFAALEQPLLPLSHDGPLFAGADVPASPRPAA